MNRRAKENKPAIPGRVASATRNKHLQLEGAKPWASPRARELWEWWPEMPAMRQELAREIVDEWDSRKSEIVFNGKDHVIPVREGFVLHLGTAAPGHPRARVITKDQYEAARELLELLPKEPKEKKLPPNPDGRKEEPQNALAKKIAIAHLKDSIKISIARATGAQLGDAARFAASKVKLQYKAEVKPTTIKKYLESLRREAKKNIPTNSN